MEVNKQAYDTYVKEITPTHNVWLNMFKAFLVGGTICALAQLMTNYLISLGMLKEDAGVWTMLVLISTSILLTGFNIFPSIVKFGGAGALVPITGFSNAVVAPAIEYKAEGHVFGIGCKIFTIAGPVILYGLLSSWVLGLIYWIWQVVIHS